MLCKKRIKIDFYLEWLESHQFSGFDDTGLLYKYTSPLDGQFSEHEDVV